MLHILVKFFYRLEGTANDNENELQAETIVQASLTDQFINQKKQYLFDIFLHVFEEPLSIVVLLTFTEKTLRDF